MAKALIIDDSKFQRNVIKNILKDLNFDIAEASNGNEALEQYELHLPDFIILDLLMPDKDGFDVLSDLKSKGNHVPIIVLSADIQESSIEKCKELGAFAFLNKPPKNEDLINTVKKALTLN